MNDLKSKMTQNTPTRSSNHNPRQDEQVLPSLSKMLTRKGPQSVVQLQSIIGNRATRQLIKPRNPTLLKPIQRWIDWDTKAEESYKQNAKGLLEALTSEFYYVPKEDIQKLINEVDGYKPKWSPYQAYQAIKKHIQTNYSLPPSEVELGSTKISSDEAKWYFISNFKTMTEVVITAESKEFEGKKTFGFKFVNTPDDNHAEDNMTRELNKFIEEKGWHKNFEPTLELSMLINNSPCKRCAPRLYDWKYRDLFVEFGIKFANMYEKETGFTEATTKLRSGGITMNLMSVTQDLLPLIKKESEGKYDGEDERKKKDVTEKSDWKNWKKDNMEEDN